MKGHDLGKDCLAAGSAYRAVPSRETLPGPDGDHYELSKVQDAFETAARAEGGLSLDGGNAADAKELEEDAAGRSKYHHSVCVLKPIRSTSKYQHPVDNAGLFSFMTFNWLTSLAVLAHKKGQLFLEDIWAVSQFESCEINRRRLAGLWEEEIRSRGDDASLRRVVWHFCRTRLLLSILCLMVTQLAGFSGPVSNTISALCRLSGVFSSSPSIYLSISLLLCLSLSLCIISVVDAAIKSCIPSDAQVSVKMGKGMCYCVYIVTGHLLYLCGVSNEALQTRLSAYFF